MKKVIIFIACNLFASFCVSSQTLQISVGAVGTDQFFYDTEYDPSDGSTINVGYTNNAATANDPLMVKLNSNHQVVWQKYLPNSGDDYFLKVIICSNGDYVVIGQMYQAGVRRAVVCRINSVDGSLIWASASLNAGSGEIFWDVVETSNHNIAIAGYENFAANVTNSYVLLLNAAGSRVWSFASTRASSDGFQTIAQLPNNNLIVGGIYIQSGSSYNAAILELNESNGSIVAQNTYAIGSSIPGLPYFLNSLAPTNISIIGGEVVFRMNAYAGFGSSSTNCILKYDQTTKSLSGNLLYHSGSDNASGYVVLPITANDYLVASSYGSPAATYISRITNGAVVYNRKLNGVVSIVYGGDIQNSSAIISGTATIGDLEAYDIFCSVDVPVSATQCVVSDASILVLQSFSATATTQTALTMVAGGSVTSIFPSVQTASLIVSPVCGIIPVSLVEFTAKYNAATGSTLLHWTTATELNSKLFQIERSVDGGSTFVNIGSVNAKGTSNTTSNYNYTDKNPAVGINLYRLKQIDIDDKFQYSNMVSIEVKRKQDGIYSLYPVPANNGYSFLNSSETSVKLIDISIIDASGKIIKQQHAYIDKTKPVKLEWKDMATGIYFVKIVSGNNDPSTIKLLVE